MTDGRRFDPPGHMTDFDHIADQREHRARSAAVVRADGTTVPLSVPNDFVTPTGGGYFFTPSTTAPRTVLGAAES
ncbi:hypothetical protein [Saccharothrix deserti]|uniref:hypothetical protein n=1 Tax=Saccharothrix deserti TaxID=2593674 RepID=UPI00131BE3E4|nr:hypothetical protein [Saccharothrix deserti]